MAVASGSVLAGRYELLETVGHGGMATVYRARRLPDGKVVAVKVLREPYCHDREFVERFEREAQAAASLAHPHVVPVLDSGEDRGVRFLVMEYVEGEDLKSLLRRSGPLPPARAVAVAAAVCDALQYAHARGIVHRDIKPQNILLTPTGQVKVTDFGIARALTSATITETGTVLGSVHYLPPEQAKGEPATAASDLYALGVVLYEMLTGQLPFDGESPIAVALKHLYEEPPALRHANPEVPEWLEGVVRRALAKRPEDRYPSAADMRADLEGRAQYWREGPTVVLERPAAVFRRRWRPSASAVAAVLLVVLASGMVAGWRALQAYVNVAEVTVPDFRGRSFTEAQAAAAELRLQLTVAGRQYHDRYPSGVVVDQDPPPGQKVREGRWVSVILSQGAERVLVPDVTRRPLAEATLLLEQARLRVGAVREDFDDQVPRGVVVSQEPAPGSQVGRDQAVDLVVSKGPELVTVPGLVGLTLEQARDVLHRVGLNLDRVGYLARMDVPPGTVVEQSPAAGSRVRRTQRLGVVVAVRPQVQPTPQPVLPTPPATPEVGAPLPPLPTPPAVQATAEPAGGMVRRVRLEVTLPPGEPEEVRIVVIDNRGV
ncbi:MAG: protein kinase domain-containing protein, partial [bacterium]